MNYKCSKCGNTSDFYRLVNYKGQYKEPLNYEDEDLSYMFDGTEYTYLKTIYCAVCDSKVKENEE